MKEKESVRGDEQPKTMADFFVALLDSYLRGDEIKLTIQLSKRADKK